ncbi:uncharacterized protein [Nicotiana sylvestris]|uniref:uncharacterized protein n=1 Tax=Nicotiana sylvestris TaxID=4096 RepID=UPI00388C738B
MARDMLNVPISTVASESAFSQARQQLGGIRHSLRSNALKVLVCFRDWIRSERRNQGHKDVDKPEDEELGDILTHGNPFEFNIPEDGQEVHIYYVELTKFVALKISSKNYMTWVLDAEIHLDAMGLGDAIKDKDKASTQDCTKTLIFLRHHLDEGLKIEYLTVKDPFVLWNGLKERYDNLKITSKLKLCGDNISDYDILEKTFTTFHASNMVLQQQYREKGFTKYSQLISLLLVAGRNNELLMRNHENRPTGSTPLPKEDEVYSHYANHGKGRGHIRGRSRGRGRGHVQGRKFHGVNHPPPKNNFQKRKGKYEKRNVEGSETKCYRCGGKGHWAKICRIPKHLVELYQASLKNKGSEANLVYDNEFDITHLGVADFFEHPDEKINHLIGDGSVVRDD